MTIQEFDLPARWRTLLLDNYSEAIHNLEVTWPDVQSLEVSYRDIEYRYIGYQYVEYR